MIRGVGKKIEDYHCEKGITLPSSKIWFKIFCHRRGKRFKYF